MTHDTALGIRLRSPSSNLVAPRARAVRDSSGDGWTVVPTGKPLGTDAPDLQDATREALDLLLAPPLGRVVEARLKRSGRVRRLPGIGNDPEHALAGDA